MTPEKTIGTPELETVFGRARQLMGRSRALLLELRAKGFRTYIKEDSTEVTDADRAVETFLREELHRAFPSHGIVGEELDAENPGAEFVWYLDPIDGTQNFSAGIPTFASIVALYHGERALLAIVDHPALDRCHTAARGLGAFENDRRITLSDLPAAKRAEEALITLSSPANYARTGDVPRMVKFIERHANVRIYGDAFSQTSAVTGRVGAAVHYNVKKWDVAAVPVLIEEAGGTFLERVEGRDLPGGPFYRVVHGRPRVVEYLRPWFIDA